MSTLTLSKAEYKVAPECLAIQDQIVRDIVKAMGEDFLKKSPEEKRKAMQGIVEKALHDFQIGMQSILKKYPIGSTEHLIAEIHYESGGAPRFYPSKLQKEIEATVAKRFESEDSDSSSDI